MCIWPDSIVESIAMSSNVVSSSVHRLLALSCSRKRATDDHATPFIRAGNINTYLYATLKTMYSYAVSATLLRSSAFIAIHASICMAFNFPLHICRDGKTTVVMTPETGGTARKIVVP